MNNYEGYLKGMEKSMQEKLFFLEYIDLNSYDLIIDFGCASGDLIERLRVVTSTKIVGIEKDAYMQNILSQRQIQWKPNLNELGNLKGKKVLIIFSSVLHEIILLQTLQEFRKRCLVQSKPGTCLAPPS
jgi:trans-aconitate methyltransferase